MRKRFDPQIELGQTPIEQVPLPLKSRDELPPILAGLQWIFQTPEINEAVFELLEQSVIGDKQENTGRPGMDLWHILVLGVTRLGLNCDYDRIEHLANYDGLLRQIMGLPSLGAAEDSFHHKTISDNICHIDEAMLRKINAIVTRHGLPEFKKNTAENLEVKFDSYVLETNIHYPTDINLLWDAARKSIEIISKLYEKLSITGWRKKAHWKRQLKTAMRACGKAASSGGPNKAERVKSAATTYVQAAYAVEEKIEESIHQLRNGEQHLTLLETSRLNEAVEFQNHLIHHIDLVERRLIRGESIPHEEKVFSLFEEHTELIKKGKVRPPVEFGHRLLIASEAHGLILDYKVMEGGSESEESVPLIGRLLNEYGEGNIQSVSCDKGFSSEGDRELIELYIPEVNMPKKGRRSVADKDRESGRRWKKLKNAHSAVESNINCLEQHGLDRCPDKGLGGYQRYVGLGVLAYNLHKIGGCLLAKQRKKQERRRRRAGSSPRKRAA